MCFLLFRRPYSLLLFVLVIYENKLIITCESISSAQFNASLRDFSSPNGNIVNVTDVKTLQKQDDSQFYNQKYSRTYNPIRFKETADNSLSSSSYSRGFAPHEYSGYNFNGYEIGPYEGGLENFHHVEHEPHFSLDHGYHHKIHDHHALAVKTFLWPLAGIALLGAAAALVTNPVLLQLGVVSGRRRRSTYETTTASNVKFHEATDSSTITAKNRYETYPIATRRNFNSQRLFKRVNKGRKRVENSMLTTQSNLESNLFDIPLENNLKWDDKRLIPIALKFKKDKT